MIKLVENNQEAALVLERLSVDLAPVLAAKMFTEGFGVMQDFLQFYAAFNDNGKLCAAFIKCNDRVFCLIETLYDKEEILLFLNGFQDFKIFISNNFAYIIDRNEFYTCNLMVKNNNRINSNILVNQIDSKEFSNIIMSGKDREAYIRFLLNNSHLERHGYLKNFAEYKDEQTVSIASVYNDNNVCYLCNVYTPIEFRSQGFATELVSKITDNNKEYHLICHEDLAVFYEKCGFSAYSRWVEFLY